MPSRLGRLQVRDLAKTQHGSLASDILARGEAHELGTFWLRKTRKVVMAVLLTQKGGVEDVG